MADISKISGLGRPLDFSYETNRGIVYLTLITFLAGTGYQMLQDVPTMQSAIWGLLAGLSVFFAWAICRELDPDRDLSAFVSAGITFSLVFFWAPANLVFLFWILLLIRTVNRTTGIPPTLADAVILIGLSGWITWQENWGYGLLTALAFTFDSRLKGGLRRQFFFAGLVILITIVLIYVKPQTQYLPGLSFREIGWIIGLFLGLFLIISLVSRKIRSTCDITGEPLRPLRIHTAQLLAVLVLANMVIWNGIYALKTATPLAAAILGMLIYSLMSPLRKKLIKTEPADV